MKRLIILMSCLVVGYSPLALGTTVGFTPFGRTVTDSLGTPVGTNSIIWVGNFTSEAFTFNPSLSIAQNITIITLSGGWKRFGMDTSTGATNPGVTLPGIATNANGKVAFTLTDDNAGPTKADYFDTKDIYLWIFNATSTQMGIFKAPFSTPLWNFKTNSSGVPGNQELSYSTSASVAPNMTAVGGAGNVTSTQMQLAAAVPEPSVIALSGLAVMGMLSSRKRRNRK